MNYRYTPFPKDSPIFPTHEQVLKYLQEYADKEG